jgi:hypothetical protein
MMMKRRLFIYLVILFVTDIVFTFFIKVPPIFHYYRSTKILLLVLWGIYILWITVFTDLTIGIIKNIILQHFNNNFLLAIQIIMTGIFFASIALYSYTFIINRGSNVIFFSEADNLWTLWFNVYWFLNISNLANIILVIISFLHRKKIFGKNNTAYFVLVVIEIVLSLFHILNKVPKVT